MSTIRRLLCALGVRRFCEQPATKPRPEIENLRERQRDLLLRAEALGVRVEVQTRGRYGRAAAND